MSHRPLIVHPFAPSRSVLLATSFAACGVLLLVLFAGLMGCTPFGSTIDPVGGKVVPPPGNALNAFECVCDCEAATAFADETLVTDASDDASRHKNQTATVLDGSSLDLGTIGNGTPNVVGLRFEHVGIPAKSKIISASIQFTASQQSPPDAAANLEIDVVNVNHALPFVEATDLQTLPVSNAPVPWPAATWTASDEALPAERTPDLASLLQLVVDKDGFGTDSSVAFIINGAVTAPGRRVAKSFDGSTIRGTVRPQAPKLTIQYKAPKSSQTLLVCGNPADADAQCKARVQTTVGAIANTCKLADTCTCGLKPASAAQFSDVCNQPCDHVDPPADCNPDGLAKATATANTTPICLGQSPLGSALFARRSVCDVNADPNAPPSTVALRFVDGDDSNTRTRSATGRVEFLGTPCPGGTCPVGMTHRLHIADITIPRTLPAVGSDTIAQLSGVGESLPGREVGLNAAGEGTFGLASTVTSGRGHHNEGNDTTAFLAPNLDPISVTLGGWQHRAVCTLTGTLVGTGPGKVCSAGPPRPCVTTADCGAGGGGVCTQLERFVTMTASIRGLLVNQPPAADAKVEGIGPDQKFECQGPDGAMFALDGSESFDPDNNIASVRWFSGSRTGELIGTLPRLVRTQGVNTTTSYLLKVTDTFGQYDEASTNVSVVDETAPTVKAPADRTAECMGAFTPVALEIQRDPEMVGDKAKATDVCDPSVVPGSDAAVNFPKGFPLGTSTVTWTATDDSGNTGSAIQKVVIVDTTPPVITVALSPAVLWPPNHKLVPITASITVQDACDPKPTVKLVSITSSEPDNGVGDGDTTGDIQGAVLQTDDRAFLLRSERSGPGGGRVYIVTYKASDASGNTTTQQATVTVPKNQSAKP